MSQISTKLLVQFSSDFAQLLESEYDYNVIVKVGQQSLKLHSLILYQCSSFFRQELTTTTKKNNIIEITLTDTTVETFKILIKKKLIKVLSNKLGLAELVEYIQSYLIDNKASWLKLKFAKTLQIFCTDILAKHPNVILASDEFTSIKEHALINLLKRDDLQIKESEIWDKNFLDLKTTLDQCIPLIRYFQMSGKDIVAKVKPYRQILD
ncbi:hypothetical protein C2G38_2231558 [Gigaspora rosea]|uniref:BTB domain-containing protein n=1 Tax=Gigaspora rosea TaxID=44941 RepID=A0A397TWC3_9GLOM|nr:hypothetical protein C2G38_2231558 [Gigaspora rosea]